MTPKQFAERLAKLKITIEKQGAIAIAESAELVKAEAKAWIGEDHESWSPLADKTLKEKERLGYETPKPLLRTGELRDSIEAVSEGLHAFVGSNHELAKIHEHGTSTIPPRPFISSAMMEKASEVRAILQQMVSKALKNAIR